MKGNTYICNNACESGDINIKNTQQSHKCVPKNSITLTLSGLLRRNTQKSSIDALGAMEHVRHAHFLSNTLIVHRSTCTNFNSEHPATPPPASTPALGRPFSEYCSAKSFVAKKEKKKRQKRIIKTPESSKTNTTPSTLSFKMTMFLRLTSMPFWIPFFFCESFPCKLETSRIRSLPLQHAFLKTAIMCKGESAGWITLKHPNAAVWQKNSPETNRKYIYM